MDKVCLYNFAVNVERNNNTLQEVCYSDVSAALVHLVFVLIFFLFFVAKWVAPGPRNRLKIPVRFQDHNSRWLLFICLFFVVLCDIGDAVLSESNTLDDSIRPHVFLTPAVTLLATVVTVVFYHKLEGWHRPRYLLLFHVYWPLLLAAKIAKIVQLFGIGLQGQHLRVSITLAYVVGYFFLWLVELSCVFSQEILKSETLSRTPVQNENEEVKYLYHRASFLSKATFFWLNPLLWLGFKKPLELSDLGALPEIEKTESNYHRFYEIYTANKASPEAKAKSSYLWKCFLKTCSSLIVLAGFFKLLGDIVEFVAPLSIGVIIKYVADLHNKSSPAIVPNYNGSEFISVEPYFATIQDFFHNGYVMGFVVLFSTLIHSTFTQISFHLSVVAGIHVRSAMQTLIYNKALKMSTWQPGSKGFDSGAIVNHMSADVFNLMMCFMMGHFIWAVPLKVAMLLILLYLQLGYSALIGASSILLFMPLQFKIGAFMSSFQKKTLEVTDLRLKKTSELLQCMKLLKLYAWEFLYCNQIHDLRQKEMKLLRRDALCWSTNSFLTQTSTVIITLVSFALYATVEGEPLTPEKVFTSLALFGQLAVPLIIFPITIPIVINAVVSSKRLTKFLSSYEIEQKTVKRFDNENDTTFELDPYSGSVLLHIPSTKTTTSNKNFRDTQIFLSDSDDDVEGDPKLAVELENASFTWDPEASKPILQNISTKLPAGGLTIIVGSIGSGKTSFVSAILGEMSCLDGKMSWSRNSAIAYAPQKPWLLNATLKDNILFGMEFDERRYKRVIEACALQPDIDLLPGGDMTEIGEKGVNLSGGQKQRIAVARTLYSRCRTVLLDDPLSALDAQVGLHVFEEGIKKLLLSYKRTVILVTHRLQFLPQAEKIIVLEGGQIKHQGSLKEISEEDPELCNRWKATMNQEEKECRQENAGQKTAKERWQLLRVLSQTFSMKSMSAEEEIVSRPRPFNFQRQISCDTGQPCPVHELNDDELDSITGSRLTIHGLGSIGSKTSWESINKIHGSQNFNIRRPSYQRMLSNKSMFSVHSGQNNIELENEDDETKGKLISEEDRETGNVSLKIYLSYLKACGFILCSVVLLSAIISQALNMGKDFWLSGWLEATKTHTDLSEDQTSEEIKYYLGVYATISILYIVMSLVTNISGQFCGLQAQNKLHRAVLTNIIQGPIRFFDTTPLGRILNRFSSDISVLDKRLPSAMQILLRFGLLCLSAIIVNAIVNPYFLLAAGPMMIVYYLMQKYFRSTSRELQRLDSITKSPILSHLSETLNGITVLRAFREEKRFHSSLIERVNVNNLTFLFVNSANRWLGISLDYLGAMIVFIATIAAISAALAGSISPSLVGLAMAYSLVVPVYLNWLVRNIADTESCMSSVERIDHYIRNPVEEYKGTINPPKDWPNAGKILMEKISLRYDITLDPVITDVDLIVQPGEKVGVCGRTGSGKSSLTMALFRMIDLFEGSVYIDDIDIAKLPLSTLRSRLSIIPQDAVLFTGTLRENLDPEHTHTDAELWKVLEMAQLSDLVKNIGAGLETKVIEGGENFSVGQRQLFCLARAILRRSKVVIMDEATASLDGETDRIVQRVMSEAFSDCTIFTIAHRLSTILEYDTILVLDAGKIVEKGSPSELMKLPHGHFAELLKAHK